MGTVLAAVSPAVVSPRMIKLIEERLGENHQVPKLILAGSSVDDIYVIVLFYAFLGLVQNNTFDFSSISMIPVTIILGVLLGVIIGLILSYVLKKTNLAKELIEEKNLYNFDIDVDENDKIICLVTCTRMFGKDDSRDFVVVARQVREDESLINYDVEETNTYKQIIEVEGLTENTTLYAIWEESVSISFDANGGSNTMLPMYIPINKESTLVSNVFKKEGFTFMSWNTKADGTGIVYVDKSTITSTENITLYAQWNQSTYHNGYEYVDLGLSVKWATCNVGADSPYEYGDYYAWGEVETKSTFIPSDYNSTNNSTDLSLSYDAANANWGGEWRTPSVTEYRELMNSDNYISRKDYMFLFEEHEKTYNSLFSIPSIFCFSLLFHHNYDMLTLSVS